MSDLSKYVDGGRLAHFTARILADAMSEGTAIFWERRAREFDAAAPRPGDFRGRASDAELAEAGRRCREAAAACRARASLEGPGLPVEPMILAELGLGVDADGRAA